MIIALVALATLAFLFGPIAVVIWSSFSPDAGLTLDFTAPSLRWYRELFNSSDFIDSFWQSLFLAGLTTALSLILGTCAAYAVGRFRFRGRELVNTILLSPLMIPGVAIGLSLGQFLSDWGFPKGYTTLLIGHVLVTVPYVARTVGAALTGVDPKLALAARDLGASPLRAFLLVTLPLLQSGLFAGALFAFITSFDELTVSLFLSGVQVVPLPVRLYTYLETVIEPTAAAASTFLVLLSLTSILLVEWLVGLDRVLGGLEKPRRPRDL